jgi:hypothetical protein
LAGFHHLNKKREVFFIRLKNRPTTTTDSKPLFIVLWITGTKEFKMIRSKEKKNPIINKNQG